MQPGFLDTLKSGFEDFFRDAVPGNPQKAEYLLPIFIGSLLQKGEVTVKVLPTQDSWFGVTYREDREAVVESFRRLIEGGEYQIDLYTFEQLNNEDDVEKSYGFLDPSSIMTLAERQRMADKMIAEMPTSFHGALAYIMKGRCTVDELVAKTGISRSTILRLRTEERKQYNLDQVVAICIALNLPMWMSQVLLDRARLSVSHTGPYAHYGLILECFYRDTIEDVNKFLTDNKLPPLNYES